MKVKEKNLDFRITEKYGLTGDLHLYVKTGEQNKFLKISKDTNDFNASKFHFFYNFFRKVFLPQGYPKTVSDDYFKYQFYDTIQAFASRITGTIATKSILKIVGVGNAEATPLSAAITWIFKDGTGMLGGILFAWFKGSEFDSKCKCWRLFADVLNDIAMTLELILPTVNNGYFSSLSLFCLTTVMKSMVGVAGSATRAAITQHQAIAQNAADVAAKDGSQETAVNLIASIFGIFMLTFIEDSRFEWSLFLFFICIHILANLLAVNSLIFQTLNTERFIILMKSYLRFDSAPSLEAVNRSESIFLFSNSNSMFDFCGWDVHIGCSFSDINNTSNIHKILLHYRNKDFVIVPLIEKKVIIILLKSDEPSSLILTAYFHAIILALSYHILRGTDLDYLKKRMAQNSCLLSRLKNVLSEIEQDMLQLIETVNQFVESESALFLKELKEKDWRTDVHSIFVEDWRIENFEFVN